MNVETISSDALTKGAGLRCDAFAGKIADGDYDFDAMQSNLAKRMIGKGLHAAKCDSLALP